MIHSYEIKRINGEDVLYLYFDLNSEFGKFNFKENIDKLEDVVKKFIEENKIAFTGLSVAIIVGGVLAYNVSLKSPINTNPEILDNNTNITEVVDTNINKDNNTSNEVIEENPIVEEKIESSTNINQNNQIENNIETSKPNTALNNQNNNIETAKPNHITNNQINNNVENVQKEEIKNEIKEEVKVEVPQEKVEEVPKVEESKIYVTVYRTNGEIINLELEEYIVGVVGAEMPASFNIEALKAQAILARTYALKAIERGTNLTDNSSTQNYKSNNELRNMWQGSFDTYYNKVRNAVYSTEGMYLTYNGTKIEAVYHSTSNGYTENASNVWGNSFPYLVTVESPYDSLNKSFEAEKFISYFDLSSKLGIEINSVTNFNILGKTSGNRVDTIEINGVIYSGVKFRNLLGLRSADFDIIKSDNGITFKTRGYGHGVGMSQYGANGMANNGYSYSNILSHYYRGTNLNHI